MGTNEGQIKNVFSPTEIDFRKIFFTFTSVWGNGKCWSAKNYFLVDHKIKALQILVYTFIFCKLFSSSPKSYQPNNFPIVFGYKF